jgi:hypothetical protein
MQAGQRSTKLRRFSRQNRSRLNQRPQARHALPPAGVPKVGIGSGLGWRRVFAIVGIPLSLTPLF